MLPPLRTIVIRPKKNRRTYIYANTGWMGMPGTGMKTMTPQQWNKWSAKRDMKFPMRPNASSGLSRNTDSAALVEPELDTPGLPLNDLLAPLPNPVPHDREVLSRDALRSAVRDLIVEHMSWSP
jgi:hypothetical protein